MSASILHWLKRILIGLLGAILLGLILAAIIPVPRDPIVGAEDYGAGASSVAGSVSGLERQFPPRSQVSYRPPSQPANK